MKNHVKFAVLIILMLAVVVIIEYRMPRHFNWSPTFAHRDPQPFGCQVFDSVLAASMPCGYEVRRRTLWQLYHDSTMTQPHGILVLTAEQDLQDAAADVVALARKGHVLLLATTSDFSGALTDSLGVDIDYNSTFSLNKLVSEGYEKGELRWTGGRQDLATSAEIYPVFDRMVTRTLTMKDSTESVPLACYKAPQAGDEDDAEWQPVAVSRRFGKGEVIFVSAPLLLTNYMMLDGQNSGFIGHLMGRMQHLPVVRTESYMKVTAHNQTSPFYVFLQQPPLRWALYLTMLTLLAFMVFTARRRQRAIPVKAPPVNRNLEFVKLIGSLYWQEHNHADLIRKKLNYTAEEVRRQTGLDILDETSGQEQLQQLARLTDTDVDELRQTIARAQMDASGKYAVSDAELRQHVKALSDITCKLNNI